MESFLSAGAFERAGRQTSDFARLGDAREPFRPGLEDVDLTLVSGRPVTFRQELYRSYMVDRPEAPVEVGGRLAPGVDEGAVARQEETEAPPTLTEHTTSKAMMRAPAAHAFAAAPAPAPTLAPAPPPMNFAAGAATVAAEEGLTQVSFHIPFPVSVGAGRTLSLPVVDAPEPAVRVAFYDPSVDSRHPLSAVELANGGKSGLPPGIVTTYEEGDSGVAYVGDSRLSDLPAGDKRLLSYALDQKTLIEASAADATSLTRATIAKGMLNVETLNRHKATYRVKASEPRRLVIAAPKLEGWKLTEPDNAIVNQSEGRYRIAFDVKAGDGQTFVITQETTVTRVLALANIDDASLGFYLKAREIDPATQAQLATLGDLRGKQAAAEHALAEVSGQIDEVVADQTRLKNLLPVVAAGSDLQKRYLAKLDQDETALDQLKATRAPARRRATRRRRQLRTLSPSCRPERVGPILKRWRWTSRGAPPLLKIEQDKMLDTFDHTLDVFVAKGVGLAAHRVVSDSRPSGDLFLDHRIVLSGLRQSQVHLVELADAYAVLEAENTERRLENNAGDDGRRDHAIVQKKLPRLIKLGSECVGLHEGLHRFYMSTFQIFFCGQEYSFHTRKIFEGRLIRRGLFGCGKAR